MEDPKVRIPVTILLAATCFFAGIESYSQDPCSPPASLKPGEKPLTGSELVHRGMHYTTSENASHLSYADIEFFLRCGTDQDAEEFFSYLRNSSRQIVGATVLEVGQDLIRVAWDGDSYNGHLGTTLFRFDDPLVAIPQLGQKVIISGIYSS